MSVRDALMYSARQLGVSPVDLATIVSYETAGTFDPTKAGPTTQWGQHRGLIQWGQPQAQKYLGGDFSLPSQAKGIVSYMQDAGVKPGMGLLDMYSAVNAGKVGRYNASDANNGGAPGTVRDKVENQMAGHRAKAEGLIGDTYANMPDGPKGQEVYAPPSQPVDNTMVASTGGPSGSVAVDQYNSLRDPNKKSPMQGLFSALAEYPDARPANLGPMGDARQSGGGLLELLGNPQALTQLVKKQRGLLG